MPEFSSAKIMHLRAIAIVAKNTNYEDWPIWTEQEYIIACLVAGRMDKIARNHKDLKFLKNLSRAEKDIVKELAHRVMKALLKEYLI